ncbi:MAG: hypothetical protein ACLUPV_06125 [Bilophila wadsworthia]
MINPVVSGTAFSADATGCRGTVRKDLVSTTPATASVKPWWAAA